VLCALVVSGLVSTTAAGPVVDPAGAMHVTLRLLSQVTSLQGMPPTVTVAPSTKSVPVSVRRVPAPGSVIYKGTTKVMTGSKFSAHSERRKRRKAEHEVNIMPLIIVSAAKAKLHGSDPPVPTTQEHPSRLPIENFCLKGVLAFHEDFESSFHFEQPMCWTAGVQTIMMRPDLLRNTCFTRKKIEASDCC